jgi:GT2 family glycosyltransferase
VIDVSILIPVLDEAAHLHHVVDAMRGQDLDGEIELLFIDGGSTDGSREILAGLAAEDPRIRVLDNPERLICPALNIGLRAARGEYVARMDAHTLYGPGYVRAGVERLRAGGVDWVSGPPVPVGQDVWSRRVATALGSSMGRGASDKWRADGEDGGPQEWDLTTSVFAGVWRRELLDELGGWDPAWTVNEDSEMASRLLARGGRLVCVAEMAAAYTPRNSLKGLGRQYRSYGRYRARTFVRHPESAGPARVATSGLPLILASTALPGRVGRLGRLAAAAYGTLLLVQAARTTEDRGEVLPLAAVFGTMHVAFASGFLEGLLRYGPRRAAIRAAAPRPIVRADACGAADRAPTG